MSTTGQDFCQQLFDNVPAWLEALAPFTEDTRRRKSSLIDNLETPELSTHQTTTVGSTSDSATAGSGPGHIIRQLNHSNTAVNEISKSRTALRRESPQRLNVSRTRGNSSAPRMPVLYDASAQDKLASTVKSVDRMVYHIKKSGQREALKGMVRSLNKASNSCEDAAFQLLKTGGCRREAQHASAILGHLYEISRREIMEERLTERLDLHDDGIFREKQKTTVPLMPNLMVDEMDMARVHEKQNISAAATRLVSRPVR